MKILNNVSVGILIISCVLGLAGIISVNAAGPATVDLGASGNFVLLAKTGISTTGTTAIVGDIGVSPIAASAITGFALTLPTASAFSTSGLVTGKVYASDYANPTSTNLTTAVLDMQTAYTDAMGRESRTYDALADATRVFRSDDGKAHLNLITCQGAWDKQAKQYSKRLVVFTDRQ